MDIDNIRRANLLILEDRLGGPKGVADRVGMSYAQYLNLRNGAKDSETGKPRGMRKQTAWRFDDAAEVPRGWLDTPHDAGKRAVQDPRDHHDYTAAAHGKTIHITPRPCDKETDAILRILSKTDDLGRKLALAAVKVALADHKPAKVKAVR